MKNWGPILVFLLFFAAIYYAIWAAMVVVMAVGAILLIVISLRIARSIFFMMAPKAKQRYLERKAFEKAKRDEEAQREKSKKDEENKREIERQETIRREAAYRKEIERRAKEDEQRRQEEIRDADTQTAPYEYRIGRHANETLAIRYGIANTQKVVVPYHYFGKAVSERETQTGTRLSGWMQNTFASRRCERSKKASMKFS